MKTREGRIIIGPSAGHHFHGQADLQVSYHCTAGNRRGYFHKRKRLVNRAAFEYCPQLGWEYDHWFTWIDDDSSTELGGRR